VVGVFGFLMAGYGIYISYGYFGNTIGTIILVVSSVIGFGLVFYSFKTEAWTRFALKGEHNSRTNDEFKFEVNMGDEGVMVSAAKPGGKASFNDQEIAVRSNGLYIPENTKVKISKIDSNKIFVEPIK
jgi:membrane-bound ClpP family serine protease